ncbi:MAG: acyltransferase, partial [Bacteroidaceae bacterium]|nr:acyltransferase [Bacteroidaceae bacterium]
MNIDKAQTNSIAQKDHYVVLDGLRGVAALMVLVFHVFDACSSNPIPHGYLAVDMFFVLSGFVIGYSYDDRWQQGLTIGRFFRRRLIRLHPMVLMGGFIGAVVFLVQGRTMWDGTVVSWGMTLLSVLCGMLLLPALPGSAIEVRGFGEYFPLNGPFWSLFYEYIGNICYALLLRRLSNRWLAVVAVISGAFVLHVCLHNGFLGVGWSASDGGWLY